MQAEGNAGDGEGVRKGLRREKVRNVRKSEKKQIVCCTLDSTTICWKIPPAHSLYFDSCCGESKVVSDVLWKYGMRVAVGNGHRIIRLFDVV